MLDDDPNDERGAATLLRRVFGFAAFLPGQKEVIDHLLSGRSSLAIFPTGGGKSLCYQLPALALDGTAIVVSPLIALMKDQIDFLKRHNVAAEKLDSTLTLEENRAVMGALRSGALKLLYVAPERFNNERFLKSIQYSKISMFVVDEAHCISEWGHNFRPDYLKLARFAKTCGADRILALTATATPKVTLDICQRLDIAPEGIVRTDFYRPNLTILTTAAALDRDKMLFERLISRPKGATIIYVTQQKTAEAVADKLDARGLPARAYHAGMNSEERTMIQDWFMTSHDAIIVATIAFGMGIDKANIRYVYHYNLPKSLENYSQEIGRAGRDGKESICEMLVDLADSVVLENFAYGDTPDNNAIASFLTQIFSSEDQFDVNLYELTVTHDIRELVLKTLLVELELAGFLGSLTPFYERYQFKPLIPLEEMLAPFDDQRRAFLEQVFLQVKKAKIWHHIDLNEVALTISQPRDRIVRALDYLAEKGWLEIKAEGVRNAYNLLKRPAQLDVLVNELHHAALEREKREVGRIAQVVDFTRHNACQVGFLVAYFGEGFSRQCGHCSWCRKEQSKVASCPPKPQGIDPTLWPQIVNAWRDSALKGGDARSLARFAAGITSPRMAKAKLTRHPLFGSLGKVPFKDILAHAEAMS